MRLGQLVWSRGTPQARRRPRCDYEAQKGHFFEPYGFSPDDRRILLASDVDVSSGFLSPSAFNAQIFTIDAAHLDDLRRVSPPERLHGDVL
jgi:hypothetical protein